MENKDNAKIYVLYEYNYNKNKRKKKA